MPEPQTCTPIDEELRNQYNGLPWLAPGHKSITETKTKTDEPVAYDAPVVYIVPSLTNSTSGVGQLIAAKFYENKDLSTAGKGNYDDVFTVASLVQEPESEFDETNNQRIFLLAKKYEDERTSHEDHARLEILKARVRRMFPSVTRDDYEELNKITTELDEIMQEDNDLRRRFNLK